MHRAAAGRIVAAGPEGADPAENAAAIADRLRPRAADRLAVDGVAVDGVAVDGVAVDGVAVDGVAVDALCTAAAGACHGSGRRFCGSPRPRAGHAAAVGCR
jgi:hypothetical protein